MTGYSVMLLIILETWPAWGAGGRKFESSRPDQSTRLSRGLQSVIFIPNPGFYTHCWGGCSFLGQG
jgi:hypothetical protein